MRYTVSAPHSSLCAAISLPASKSISNRALVLHALAHGIQVPENLSLCDDTLVMIRALQGNAKHVDILAAGTAMRFLTAYFSVTPGTRTVTGTQRMRQRPIRILVDALHKLGAKIEYMGEEGFPPLRITGAKLQGNEISLPGNVSSQYISALLMIGVALPDGLRLHLTGSVISRPYINLTLQLMRAFGGQAEWESENGIFVHPGNYHDVPFTVESDWSAASYWYQILALQGHKERKANGITREGSHTHRPELLGLFTNSHQGDSRGAEIFARLGVQTEHTARGVRLALAGKPASRLEESMVDIPDLAQTFVVTCCLMDIPFRFTGLQSLKIKETDRIAALITELHKLGYVVRSEQDSVLLWNGERCTAEAQPVIDTYEDHRMAMAFAPASILLPSVTINHPQVVSKSYPSYWEDLRKAGFQVEEASLLE